MDLFALGMRGHEDVDARLVAFLANGHLWRGMTFHTAAVGPQIESRARLKAADAGNLLQQLFFCIIQHIRHLLSC